MQKSALRRHFSQVRKQLPEVLRSRAEKIICFHLQKHIPENAAVLSYLPYGSEVDISGFIKYYFTRGIILAPRVKSGKRRMEIVRIRDFNGLVPGYRGIPEPAEGEIWNDPVDYALVPGLCFDLGRQRTGYGGGFFDYFLQNRIVKKAVGVFFSELFITGSIND